MPRTPPENTTSTRQGAITSDDLNPHDSRVARPAQANTLHSSAAGRTGAPLAGHDQEAAQWPPLPPVISMIGGAMPPAGPNGGTHRHRPGGRAACAGKLTGTSSRLQINDIHPWADDDQADIRAHRRHPQLVHPTATKRATILTMLSDSGLTWRGNTVDRVGRAWGCDQR